MPAVSQAQRGYLGHKFGSDWMHKHHFDNKGPLPAKVGDKKKGPAQAQGSGESHLLKSLHGR